MAQFNVRKGIKIKPMSQIKFLSHKWWIKRLYAHYFINDLYVKYKIPYNKGYDFYLTKFLVYLLNNKT